MTAQQIRTLRRRLGMTQREFAKFVGVTPEYVCRLERGHCTPGAVITNLLRRMAGDVKDSRTQAA